MRCTAILGKQAAAVLMTVCLLAALPADTQAQAFDWLPFEEALAVADTSGKPVLVDVWAPWCGWCHRMKRETYPALGDALREDFVLARLNRGDNDARVHYRGERLSPLRLAQKLGAGGVPAVVFLSPGGEKLLRTEGFLEADKLRPVAAYVGSGAYRRQSYEAFRGQKTEAR